MFKNVRRAVLAHAAVATSVLCLCSPVAHAQALAGTTATTAPQNSRDGTEVDRIVAIVDTGVITEQQLDGRVAMIQKRMQAQPGARIPAYADLQQQVLQQMIQNEVLLQHAAAEGVTTSDASVDQTLQKLAQSNGMTLDQFRQRVQAQGIPWDTFRSDARDELTLNELRRHDVDSKITVSDAEVANYIASQKGVTQAPPDLHLQHLLVAVPANAPDADVQAAQKRAVALIEEAQDGRNFERLARSNSQAADAKQGGDMGFKAQAALPAALIQAASRIAPGQVSPEPVRTADGWEVVRLVARRPARNTSDQITQTHVSHILLRAGEGGSESDALRKLLAIKQDLADGKGTFAQYAKTNSQDGSASNGGDLGWINPGQTVPDFERVMNQLQVGQVSNPVRTEYGYHLIMVTGRRETNSSPAQLEEAARQAVGSRKSEQAYADWLRELYDAAYVKVMLPGAQTAAN